MGLQLLGKLSTWKMNKKSCNRILKRIIYTLFVRVKKKENEMKCHLVPVQDMEQKTVLSIGGVMNKLFKRELVSSRGRLYSR